MLGREITSSWEVKWLFQEWFVKRLELLFIILMLQIL